MVSALCFPMHFRPSMRACCPNPLSTNAPRFHLWRTSAWSHLHRCRRRRVILLVRRPPSPFCCWPDWDGVGCVPVCGSISRPCAQLISNVGRQYPKRHRLKATRTVISMQSIPESPLSPFVPLVGDRRTVENCQVENCPGTAWPIGRVSGQRDAHSALTNWQHRARRQAKCRVKPTGAVGVEQELATCKDLVSFVLFPNSRGCFR